VKKLNRKKSYTEIGEVTNAPASTMAKGFGFVQLPDGRVVYCSPEVIKSAGLAYEDIGSKVRVRYVQFPDGRFSAIRVNLLRSDIDDQGLADLVFEIDDHLGKIDEKMMTLYDMLEARGCKVPEVEK